MNGKTSPEKGRLASLDILRGFDLFLLVFFQPVFMSLARRLDAPWLEGVMRQFEHVPWEGFRVWDLIMPLFMFMAGASMPFSFAKFGDDKRAAYLRIARRVVLLFIFGMVVQGNLLGLDPHRIYLYSNTLQAIAAGYLIASVAMLHCKVRGQIAVAVLLLVAYWVPMTLLGDFTPDGNFAEAVDRARAWEGLDGQDYAARVTTGKPYEWNSEGEFHVVAFDFGIKYNILRGLAANNMRVTVLPAAATAEDALARNPDGVFLSNGPADPAAVGYAIRTIRELIGKVPLFGICLGHQLFGLASGAECGRLKFGHHGCNHPVRNLLTNRVEITSQNHNFALKAGALPATLEVTHINLNDNTIEGVRHRTEPAASVQFHPEAAPGPHDSFSLFQEFRKLMER